MKYILLVALLFTASSCAFKKVKKNKEEIVTQSDDQMDELEMLENEEEAKEKMSEVEEDEFIPRKPQRLTARQKGKMSIIDTNKDGKISYREYMVSKKSLFKRLDANGDGYLTIEELKARRYQARSERMRKEK